MTRTQSTTRRLLLAAAPAALLALGLAAGATTSPAAAAQSPHISASSAPASKTLTLFRVGDRLGTGDRVVMANGRVLRMQSDGNLVLYVDGRPRWASRTSGNPGASAVFQLDGKVMVYSAGGRALFSTPTWHSGAVYLGTTDGDGDIALYPLDGPQVWTTLWDAGRVPAVVPTGRSVLQPGQGIRTGQALISDGAVDSSDGYRLDLQADGNLVVYSPAEYGGGALWASTTRGRGGVHLVMQTDGNLVLYTASGKPVWSTATYGHPGARLVMDADGNMVVRVGGADLWYDGERL